MNNRLILFFLLFVLSLGSCGLRPKRSAQLQSESWLSAWNPDYTSVNGVSLRFLKAGEGPPLLMIHTIRTQMEYFKYILPELSRHYTVYAIDLPGHGFSGLPKKEYSHSFFHETVRDFILQQELQDLTLLGESAGATLCLSLGADPALSLRQIFAFNPYDYMEKKGAGAKRANGIARLVFNLMKPKFMGPLVIRMEARFVLKKILAGGFVDRKKLPKDVLKLVHRVARRKGFKQAELSYFMAFQSFFDARESYSNIRVPVTLTYGSADWSRPAERKANAGRIPQVKLLEIEGASHFSCLEKPEEVLGIIFNQKTHPPHN